MITIAVALAAAVLVALWPLLRPSGEAPALPLPWLLAPACLLWAAGAVAAGLLLARQRGQRELQAARTDLAALQQMLDVWLWQTDAQHRLVQLQPPRNATAEGWPAFVPQPLWDRFDSVREPGGVQGKLTAQRTFDDAVRQPDGSQWWLQGLPRFDPDGRFAGYIGTARPLDDTKTLQEDQAAFEALVSALPGPVWACTPGAGGLQVRRSNAAALRMAGAPPSSWDELMAALPRDLATVVQQTKPGEAGLHEGWVVHLLPVGEQQESRLLALLPRPGNEAESEGADNDAAAFSYTVSHDLRAPVRVVEGFTRILKEDYGRLLDRVGNDHLDRVLGAAARMNSMIDALLGLAQLSSQPLARQPVNLSQLAGYVIDDLRRHQPQRRVDVHVEPGLQVQGDPTLLRLVLENLLGNAWKYTGQRERAEIVFQAEQQDGRRVFAVRDNGAGFDMRFADRLFGVFQRLHSANDFPGTGVGLASVRRIVRRHGGDVWADAEVGQGASFYFTLRD